jgi:hypothetical protein
MKLVVGLITLSLAAVGCSYGLSDANQNPNQDPPFGGPVDLGFGGPVGPQPSFGTPVTASTPPPALSGGTLVIAKSGNFAVAADPDRDQLYIVDLLPTPGKLRATVALSPGDEPGRGVEDGAGHVHVLARRSGVVITVDPASQMIVERKAVCPAPRGIA